LNADEGKDKNRASMVFPGDDYRLKSWFINRLPLRQGLQTRRVLDSGSGFDLDSFLLK